MYMTARKIGAFTGALLGATLVAKVYDVHLMKVSKRKGKKPLDLEDISDEEVFGSIYNINSTENDDDE